MDPTQLEEAEKELPQRIDEVKSILRGEKQIDIGNSCDEFVKRCLRINDFRKDRTVKLIVQFHNVIKDMKSWDVTLEPSSYKDLYYDLCKSFPKPDSSGRRIYMTKPAVWDPSMDSFDTMVFAMWSLSQITTIEHVENQSLGCIMIWDCTGISWTHSISINHSRLMEVVAWVQTGVLGRVKELHMIFHSKIISSLYALVKPFVNERLTHRLHFHDDLASLHKHIEPSLLPPFLGGPELADESEFYDKSDIEKILQLDSFFDECFKVGLPAK